MCLHTHVESFFKQGYILTEKDVYVFLKIIFVIAAH